MSQNIVRIWMVKFGELPVICQIRQRFALPKIRAIRYITGYSILYANIGPYGYGTSLLYIHMVHPYLYGTASCPI